MSHAETQRVAGGSGHSSSRARAAGGPTRVKHKNRINSCLCHHPRGVLHGPASAARRMPCSLLRPCALSSLRPLRLCVRMSSRLQRQTDAAPSLPPGDLRHVAEVDAQRRPARRLRRESRLERRPIVTGSRGPRQIGDRRQTRECHGTRRRGCSPASRTRGAPRSPGSASALAPLAADGSQSYACRTETLPAQFNPSSVSSSYFMSRYSRLAGDRIR